MIWFSDIFHKFPRLSRISTLFLILLVVFPTVFSDGCAFSRHAPDQSARISSGYEPEQTDSVSSESTDNDNQRADSSSANAFDEFLLQLFRSEAALNTINLHFSLSSPESYGITEVPISLGSISSQASKENRAALENTTAALKRFDREKLSKPRQLTYDILSDYLAMEQKGTDFSLYAVAVPSRNEVALLVGAGGDGGVTFGDFKSVLRLLHGAFAPSDLINEFHDFSVVHYRSV